MVAKMGSKNRGLEKAAYPITEITAESKMRKRSDSNSYEVTIPAKITSQAGWVYPSRTSEVDVTYNFQTGKIEIVPGR